MYQALYRKWRPRTFDDVVGQDHITETLKRQVASGRLSHAYLFTGTRGTGKTTCAKILARAVNCEHPVDGNPCNQCAACLGIENGSILDVLELDAASNNGVDQVRALRDEAVYTPAAVRKRVYIVDEVHMLSTAAFNALLKILEEPPEHLMFILATTELHKVPATIKSRCQQFSFKRILPGQIAQRLGYVAGAGGHRPDAGGGRPPGPAGRRRPAGRPVPAGPVRRGRTAGGRAGDSGHPGAGGQSGDRPLMGLIAAHDTAGALETLGRLYGNGKDVSSVLEELSSLARDLLLRKTAPQGGAALLTGGYDGNTMRSLGEQFTAPRLLQILNCSRAPCPSWPGAAAAAPTRSCASSACATSGWTTPPPAGRPGGPAGGAAGRRDSGSVVTPASGGPGPNRPRRSSPAQPGPRRAAQAGGPQRGGHPPWEEEEPPLPPEPEEEPSYDLPVPAPAQPEAPPAPARRPSRPPPSPSGGGGGTSAFWPAFAAGLAGKVPPSVQPFLNNPPKSPACGRTASSPCGWTASLPGPCSTSPPSPSPWPRRRPPSSRGGGRVSVVVGQPPAEDGSATPGCRGEARRFGRPAGLRGPVRQHQNSVSGPRPWRGETAKKSRPPAHGGGRRKGRSVATWQKDLAAGASPAWAAA